MAEVKSITMYENYYVISFGESVYMQRYRSDSASDDPVSSGVDKILISLCERSIRLEAAIRETLEENKHLADGENCTLAKLKKVVGVE